MILGSSCTRQCRFCAVEKARGRHLCLDREEPLRVARAVKNLGIRYAVITSVTRDDLSDGGAGVFARTVKRIRALSRDIGVEVLIPDFNGNAAALKTITACRPNVVGHNIETVRRLYQFLRPGASFRRSLEILRRIKELNSSLITKSSLILGMGETAVEVAAAMRDLRKAQCDILVLGQYLAPSVRHYPVKEFVSIGRFREYRRIGMSLGFKAVLSAPLARSSYQAQEVYDSVCRAAG
jgi:lipoic acid synthetase